MNAVAEMVRPATTAPDVTDVPATSSLPTADIQPRVAKSDVQAFMARVNEARHRNDTFAGRQRMPTEAKGPRRATAPMTLLAEWDGSVESIEGHFFSASLKGIFGEGARGEEEEAEIPLSDVSPLDRELLRIGSVFRLCVFYEVDDDDQPKRFSKVVFRRLPAYREDDLQKASKRAADRAARLRVE